MKKTSSSLPLLSRGSWPEVSRVTALLRKETVGGAFLLVATVAALAWANSPWSEAYFGLRDLQLGPAALHLNLSLGTWAADGLLAIFFFVVGLELKREFVAGDLRDPRRAALPIAAAIGGMALPAGLFLLINVGGGPGALTGWAIPVATDVAFALAVLALISTHLPAALRTFLLTLAVVDDLFAISIIAIFYTRDRCQEGCSVDQADAPIQRRACRNLHVHRSFTAPHPKAKLLQARNGWQNPFSVVARRPTLDERPGKDPRKDSFQTSRNEQFEQDHDLPGRTKPGQTRSRHEVVG